MIQGEATIQGKPTSAIIKDWGLLFKMIQGEATIQGKPTSAIIKYWGLLFKMIQGEATIQGKPTSAIIKDRELLFKTTEGEATIQGKTASKDRGIRVHNIYTTDQIGATLQQDISDHGMPVSAGVSEGTVSGVGLGVDIGSLLYQVADNVHVALLRGLHQRGGCTQLNLTTYKINKLKICLLQYPQSETNTKKKITE